MGPREPLNFIPSKLLLMVDIHELCQSKEPNQRKRVPLRSTT